MARRTSPWSTTSTPTGPRAAGRRRLTATGAVAVLALAVATSGSTAPATGVVGQATTPTAAAVADRDRWSSVRRVGLVTDRRIREGSGITRSTYRRSVRFVHNDSGDGARFFALGARGRTRATFTVRRAPSQDWEDIAVGPRHTLWLGDIGDNRRRKRSISVIRVAEPVRMRSRSIDGRVFRLRYPHGPRDAEGLMVQPNTGRVFVVTKTRRGGLGGIYRAPKRLRAGRVNRMEWMAHVPERVTGADFAPGGGHFVVRTYGWAYIYWRMGGRPTKIKLPSSGESIGWNRAGTGLVLHSEGVRRTIWTVRR